MKIPNNRNTRAAKLFEGVARDREELAKLRAENEALKLVLSAADKVNALYYQHSNPNWFALKSALENFATISNLPVV